MDQTLQAVLELSNRVGQLTDKFDKLSDKVDKYYFEMDQKINSHYHLTNQNIDFIHLHLSKRDHMAGERRNLGYGVQLYSGYFFYKRRK